MIRQQRVLSHAAASICSTKIRKGDNFFLLLQSLGKLKLSDKNGRLQTFLLKSILLFFFKLCLTHRLWLLAN